MPQHFIENGVYIETLTDVPTDSRPQGSTVVPKRPSPDHIWGGSAWQWVAPVPPPATIPDLSFAQMLIGLDQRGWVPRADLVAWRDNAVLPPLVVSVILSLPVAARFTAETRALRPSVVKADNPILKLIAASAGKTDADLSAFFIEFSQV